MSTQFVASFINGKSIRFFDFPARAQIDARCSRIEMMREGFPSQFSMHYQVQVTQAGKPCGAEALLRWCHPEHGIVSPSAFIPLAEESGLIFEIGSWVMETACLQLAKWSQSAAMRHIRLSVNVSATEFERSNFSQQVLSILERTGADPSFLEIELTESLLVGDFEDVARKMLLL